MERYGTVAMLLHWVIAALILANLALAWQFEGLEGAARGAPIRLHKSIGVTVLVLSVVRLGWRLAHSPPRNPSLGRLDRALARLVHAIFYLLMIGLPLSGWAMISAATDGRPTKVWGLIDLPRITPLAHMAQPGLGQVHGALQGTHLALGLTMALLIVLHVAGALKHQFFDRHDGGLARMLPRLR